MYWIMVLPLVVPYKQIKKLWLWDDNNLGFPSSAAVLSADTQHCSPLVSEKPVYKQRVAPRVPVAS